MAERPAIRPIADLAIAAVGPSTEARIALAFATRALITAKEAASILGIDVKTLRALTDGLALRALVVGKVRRYAEADIRRYLIEGPDAECPSTSRPRAASSNMTSSTRVVGFTARLARKRDAQQRRSNAGCASTPRKGG
ncbi:MAG: helix-turn-helix domain-containing protein [Caulobacteraceae bacterium]|nr:helix-turn-helix domain-containing protein [Caulobacteraceae bacterium]